MRRQRISASTPTMLTRARRRGWAGSAAPARRARSPCAVRFRARSSRAPLPASIGVYSECEFGPCDLAAYIATSGAHQVGDRSAIARNNAMPARGDEALLAADDDRRLHQIQHAVRHALGIALVGDFGQQRDELVAAIAADRLEHPVRTRTPSVEESSFPCPGGARSSAGGARPPSAARRRRRAERVVDDESIQVDQGTATWWPIRRACSSAHSAAG